MFKFRQNEIVTIHPKYPYSVVGIPDEHFLVHGSEWYSIGEYEDVCLRTMSGQFLFIPSDWLLHYV